MKVNIGEYVVGAYLQIIKECEIVTYNIKHPSKNLKGLNEFDVLALDLINSEAYLCEVSTHLNGLNYGNGNRDTIDRLNKKFVNQQEYAKSTLSKFNVHYMFWAPYVPKGYLTHEIEQLEANGLEVVINSKYTNCVEDLRKEAVISTKDYDNPFYLSLQILSHLK